LKKLAPQCFSGYVALASSLILFSSNGGVYALSPSRFIELRFFSLPWVRRRSRQAALQIKTLLSLIIPPLRPEMI